MKLPLKIDVSLICKSHEFNELDSTFNLKIWLKELSESYNSTIDYIEQLEERIKDLEKNELY